MPTKLKPENLRWHCDDKTLSFFKDFNSLPSSEGIIGQARAVSALDMGLRLYRPGYNIYVAGITGTGRLTTIKRALKQTCIPSTPPPDRCYVYNFTDPSVPLLLTFDPGLGRQFKDDMDEMIRMLKTEIPKTLESEAVSKERELILERYQREEKKVFEEFANKLKSDGFALIQVQEGGYISPAIFFVVGEEAVSIDAIDRFVSEGKIPAQEVEEKKKKHKIYTRELKEVLTRARGLGRDMHQALDKLLQRSTSTILDGLMDDMLAKYKDKKVRKYLLKTKSHILTDIESFAGKDKKQEGLIFLGARQQDPFWVYEVNLLFDQSSEQHEGPCPMVEEPNPSYVNLFGAIEYHVGPSGAWSTDFRHIKAGSLLKADGGFIIINALDILKRPFVWDQLKRVLKTESLIIQPPEYSMTYAPMAMKPEPIKLNVKVIMIGPTWVYHILYSYEEEFAKIFKVLADFDSSMPLDKEAAEQYASVLKAVSDRGEIRPFDKSGIAALLEYGVEDSGQRERLSTRFSHITDILRESDFWASEDKSEAIQRKHVETAIEKWRWRHSLIEERVQRMIDEGVINIDTEGKKVGQINGLSVYSLGHATFGKPARVTASIGVGKAGLINIEREAKLSGPTHDKGVLILGGYLRQQYASNMPIAISASVCFEQSYGGIDGDSASSTELYCLLSAISDVPINQELAVTGSVDQKGNIQAIGGVNEKIEGFYEVCKSRGLTGKQGVIIPKSNQRHLMLKHEIVDAVRKGRFHVYSISHVDEGIELLMGLKAGERSKKGEFPKASVHGKVHSRIKKMSESLKKAGQLKSGTARAKKKRKKTTSKKAKKKKR